MIVPKSINSDRRQSAGLAADDVRLLAAIGFMAARTGLTELATRIFHGLCVVRPEAAFPRTGMVMAYLSKGDCEMALQYTAGLREPNVIEDIELRALKALTLFLLNRTTEAENLIAMVVNDPTFSSASDSLVGKVVALLDSAEKDYARAVL